MILPFDSTVQLMLKKDDLKDGSFKIPRNWEMFACIDSSSSKAYACEGWGII